MQILAAAERHRNLLMAAWSAARSCDQPRQLLREFELVYRRHVETMSAEFGRHRRGFVDASQSYQRCFRRDPRIASIVDDAPLGVEQFLILPILHLRHLIDDTDLDPRTSQGHRSHSTIIVNVLQCK